MTGRTFFHICGNDACKKEFSSNRKDKLYCCDACRWDHLRRTVKYQGASHRRLKVGFKTGGKLYRNAGL